MAFPASINACRVPAASPVQTQAVTRDEKKISIVASAAVLWDTNDRSSGQREWLSQYTLFLQVILLREAFGGGKTLSLPFLIPDDATS